MSWFQRLNRNTIKNFPSKILNPLEEEVLAQFYLPYANLTCYAGDYQNDWLSAGTASVQGWRISQEDAHLCDLDFDLENQVALFGVFDGHNGPEVSWMAAKKLPQIIKNNSHYQKQEYATALQEAFLEFDASLLEEESIKEMQQYRRQYENSYGRIRRRKDSSSLGLVAGSTAVVALLCRRDGSIFVANIGDSRCVLCLRNKPRALSRDHKPTDDEEFIRIVNAGAQVINGRINQGLNLSRAFGDHFLKNNEKLEPKHQAVSAFPDIIMSREKIREGDFLVLACDGIWNCMENKEVCDLIQNYLKKKLKLSKIGKEIIQKCVCPVRPIDGQLGGDNMTIVIVQFDQDCP